MNKQNGEYNCEYEGKNKEVNVSKHKKSCPN